jgi:hypothetical protein
MSLKRKKVQKFGKTSPTSFKDAVRALGEVLGHHDTALFPEEVTGTLTGSELENCRS